jgi:hypothetical protein
MSLKITDGMSQLPQQKQSNGYKKENENNKDRNQFIKIL